MYSVRSKAYRRYVFLKSPNPASTRHFPWYGTCICRVMDWCSPLSTLHSKYPIVYWFLFSPATTSWHLNLSIAVSTLLEV